MQSTIPLRCSAVVTTGKRSPLLERTLESLTRQSYPDVEIVVVCDEEDASSRSICQNFGSESRIRWVAHPNDLGLATARNAGALEASGEIVLFLDDKSVADPELIAVHMRHHQSTAEHRRLALCGLTTEECPVQLSSYVNKCLQEVRNRELDTFSTLLSTNGVCSVGEEIERILFFGLNCSIRRDLFLSYGGFNGHFHDSGADRELGMRLHLAGVELVFESCRLLTHANPDDLESHFRNCWSASGALDAYRVFQLGQKNVQTQRLMSMFHGYLLDRSASRCAWYLSKLLLALSRWLATAANRTKRHFVFNAWARVSPAAEYWCHVKDSGCTAEQLKGAVGSTKCALILHSLCEPLSREEASYNIAPGRFRRLMRWFKVAGYKTATTAEWIEEGVPENRVLLTFDDGYDDLYDELLPLVIEHHYTPLIFLVAERIGTSNVWDQESGLRPRDLLSLEQIREMQKYGAEFGSHTMTHPRLPSISDAQLRHEVGDSKHRLEDLLGVEVTSFAYPFGGVDRRVRSAVADAGYKLAFTVEPGLNWWNDPLCQRRTEVNNYTTLADFAFKLRNGRSLRESLALRRRSCCTKYLW